jgi:hypothetical protein
VTVFGMVMLVKPVHPLNELTPIDLTNDPNVTFVSDVRPLNALEGMVATLRFTVARLVHPEKTLELKVVRVAFPVIEALVRPVQFRNA